MSGDGVRLGVGEGHPWPGVAGVVMVEVDQMNEWMIAQEYERARREELRREEARRQEEYERRMAAQEYERAQAEEAARRAALWEPGF